MSTGSDEPNHGREYPPLENSGQTGDPYAPVDYPTESAPPPNYGAPTDFQQQGYPPPGYQQPGYPPPGYPQTGYPPPGYPPQYQGGYGYDPYAPARPAGTNGKAIAALVTSLSGLILCGVPSIVGLILGIIAMRETKRTGQEGHGMALAAVIVGALAILGWIAYFVVIVVAIAVTSTPTYGY